MKKSFDFFHSRQKQILYINKTQCLNSLIGICIMDTNDQKTIFIDAIGHATLILDRDHNIIAVNQATLKLTGYTQDKLVGKKCYELFHNTNTPPDKQGWEK